jgi:response regulator RpfG family c-di-GMP phosphodiesterase
VIVVDDDPLIGRALQRILEVHGFEIVVAENPAAALAELSARPVGLIISDYMMPGMDGVQFLVEARKLCPDAPRLLLTAINDFKVATEAVNNGEVYRLLAKPWTQAELVTTVKQAWEVGQLKRQHAELTRLVQLQNAELQRINRNLEALVQERTSNLLEGMVAALDYRDTETQWHSRRVAQYARRLAVELGLAEQDLLTVEMGSLLHDIGKIGVRDSVLLKPGPLSPEEWGEMREHPGIGHRLLRGIDYLKDAGVIVLHHQERWDGKGYPSGLKGPEIAIGARIFAVVDTLDAIRSDRPYRQGRPFDVALAEIRRCAGTQFDPEVVEAFARVPEAEWEAIRRTIEQMAADSAQADAADGLGTLGSWRATARSA